MGDVHHNKAVPSVGRKRRPTSQPSNLKQEIDQTRVLYNNGYGDFVFGRLIDKTVEGTEKEYREEWFMEGSNGIAIEEIGGFKRQGRFPFFRLPLSVRIQIYRIILEPFYILDPNLKSSYIWLTFTAWAGMACRPQDLSGTVISLRRIYRYTNNHGTARTHENRANLPHPLRANRIPVKAHPVRKDSKGQDQKDWYLCDWVRKLSNVSTLLRKELAEEFWSRTCLSIGCFDVVEPPVVSLIKERPQITRGIRMIHWEAVVQPSGARTYSLKEDLDRFCDWTVAEPGLRLESCKITLRIRDQKGLSIVDLGPREVDVLASCRGIPVEKDFQVDFILEYQEVRVRSPISMRQKIERDFNVKYAPLLREVMLPDSLRPQLTAPTREECYLKERLQSSSPMTSK